MVTSSLQKGAKNVNYAASLLIYTKWKTLTCEFVNLTTSLQPNRNKIYVNNNFN